MYFVLKFYPVRHADIFRRNRKFCVFSRHSKHQTICVQQPGFLQLVNSTFHDFCAVFGKSSRKASDNQSPIPTPGSLAFTKLEITNKAKSFVNHLVGRTGRLRVAKTNEMEIKMLVPMRRRSYCRGVSASSDQLTGRCGRLTKDRDRYLANRKNSELDITAGARPLLF